MSQSPIERLLSITHRLRDPQKGCPWDQEQTFATIAPHTLEETYEVLDAIGREDYNDLRQELGDLLFQVVFYTQMAKEQALFDFTDVCQAINDKLIRRHPHVFGDVNVTNSSEVLEKWEQYKQIERSDKSQHSALDDIPQALPALMRAHKIQQRCASVGFDWPSQEGVIDKVHEEIDEIVHELRQEVVDKQKLAEELGDLLFTVVNLTRHMGFKAETVLQSANRKFERRFRQLEQDIAAQGHTVQEVSLEVMEMAWQQIKAQEK